MEPAGKGQVVGESGATTRDEDLLAAQTPAAGQQVFSDTAPADLKPGEFVWMPEASPAGPVVILVSITEQRLYAYRNGILIAYSTVSTGKPGHETPTGVFHVLEKDADHESNLFPGAKMPNMERLTWTGIALHAGNLPGYPASHGCVRLPLEMSRLLFELDPMGTTVVIADEHGGPREAVHPGLLLSPDIRDTEKQGPVAGYATFEWQPERSPEGPISVVLSTADGKLYVYRSGVEIRKAEVEIKGSGSFLHEGVFTVLDGFGDRESPPVAGKPDHHWMSVATTPDSLSALEEEQELADRVHIAPFFAARLYEALVPGSTLVVTNREAAPHTRSESDFVVIATHHDQDAEVIAD
jgi:hypothetical protein